MVFVKISIFHWIVIHILHYSTAVLEILALNLFLGSLSNLATVDFLPQVDKNDFFKLSKYIVLVSETVDAFLYNSLLIILFWYTHIVMAGKKFKEEMNKRTGNIYYYYDRSVYNLIAGTLIAAISMTY